MLTKEQAELRGNTLHNRMKGPGWELYVWENLGWHHSVCNGAMVVRGSSLGPAINGAEDEYDCLMNSDHDDPHGGGHLDWTTNFSSGDPNEVVLHQLREARDVLNRYIKAVTYLEGVMGIEHG